MNKTENMSSSYSCQWTPDVFVSFKENEVELERFTSALLKRLKEAGIGYRHFGQEVVRNHKENREAMLDAIRWARFALVMLSVNYASSNQCLEELVKILRRSGHSKYPGLVVIPIFHGNPAKVLEIWASDKSKQALDSADEKMKEWRPALAKLEGISGYELKKDATEGDESKLIGKIVGCLVNEIWSLYSHKVFGPFGGSGEQSWHCREINGIYVEYNDIIKSIKFDVKENTNTEEQRGETDRHWTYYKVKLGKEEHITSFSGSMKGPNNGGIRINSIKFETNKRTLEPFNRKEEGKSQDKKEEEKKQKKKGKGKKKEEAGEEKEESFSVPLPSGAGKVIEFFGSKRGDDFLTSIGARVELARVELSTENSTKNYRPVGFFGSRRGKEWSEWPKRDVKGHSIAKGIRAELDSRGSGCIRSIKFRYEEENGVRLESREHGSHAERHKEFIINGEDEYLSSISGYCNHNGITSLTFLTNKKNSKVVGHAEGVHFSSPPTGCEIVGFYGWGDEHLHGIGAYFKPIPDLDLVESIGPFGRAKAWDDGKFKGVKKVFIGYVPNDCIRYIKIVYDDASQNGCTITHGDYTKNLAGVKEGVVLEYPPEYLISISGSMQEDGSIQSLAFDSNKQRYGPYGKEEGEYFWYPSNETRIIGFYGTWGKTLDSIGVYVEPIKQKQKEPIKQKPTANISPLGSLDGPEWDDGKHSNVTGFRVTEVGRKDSLKIESITFMYDNKGSLVEGSRHGGGDKGEWVMLDFPKERLKEITGWKRKEAGQTIIPDLNIIHDLNIETTRTNHPYATRAVAGWSPKQKEKEFKGSKYFSITKNTKSEGPRRIVGFYGTAGEKYLNSVEAHLEPS